MTQYKEEQLFQYLEIFVDATSAMHIDQQIFKKYLKQAEYNLDKAIQLFNAKLNEFQNRTSLSQQEALKYRELFFDMDNILQTYILCQRHPQWKLWQIKQEQDDKILAFKIEMQVQIEIAENYLTTARFDLIKACSTFHSDVKKEQTVKQLMDLTKCSQVQALKHVKNGQQTLDNVTFLFYRSGEIPENAPEPTEQNIKLMMESTNTSREQAVRYLKIRLNNVQLAIDKFKESGETPLGLTENTGEVRQMVNIQSNQVPPKEQDIKQMMESTNASRKQAIRFLLSSNLDIDEAVNNFFDSGEEPQGNPETQNNPAYSNSGNTDQEQQSHNSNNQQQHLMQQYNQIQTQKQLLSKSQQPQNHISTQQRDINQQTTDTASKNQSQYRYLQLVSEQNLQQFMDISNCSHNQALKYFKHSGQTVEEALNMFYESGEVPENAQQVEDNYDLDYAVDLSLQQQNQEDQQFRNSAREQQLDNDQIQLMMESTNTSREQAIHFLQNNNYDINKAINYFFDSGEEPSWKPKQQQITPQENDVDFKQVASSIFLTNSNQQNHQNKKYSTVLFQNQKQDVKQILIQIPHSVSFNSFRLYLIPHAWLELPFVLIYAIA
ncbi:UBA-like_superfamily [Hexamita inflata]|uniref:UBA-like superfamily n=1 Tax=Hexamita inflata TaxID=28002 RepID=A0AA86THF0_9EUKA|nr:UBA-like superfamily [Hexamita inflata]